MEIYLVELDNNNVVIDAFKNQDYLLIINREIKNMKSYAEKL